ncbi:MAG: EamA family transporter [Synergistaceae bacterium]|nr:EamA family transporter [Synergistaceae bacterium]
MWKYYIPIIIVICSNTLYHVCSKSTPRDANMFMSLIVTYLVATASSIAFYLFSVQNRGLVLDIKSLNWTSILLGIGVFGIELGFIKMYRAGWNISTASLLTNAAISILLIFIGLIFYREHLSSNQMIGIALCLAGLFFFNR